MTEILLLIVVFQLAWIIGHLKKDPVQTEKIQLAYRKVLPDYLNKRCEITLREPLAAIDAMYNVTGTLVDFDEDWVMLEVQTKKRKTMKMFQIDNIAGIKEIQ